MIWFLSFLAFFPLPTPTRTTVSPLEQELYCLISAVFLNPSTLHGTWWRLNICLRMSKCFAQGWVLNTFSLLVEMSESLQVSLPQLQEPSRVVPKPDCLGRVLKFRFRRPTPGPWKQSVALWFGQSPEICRCLRLPRWLSGSHWSSCQLAPGNCQCPWSLGDRTSSVLLAARLPRAWHGPGVWPSAMNSCWMHVGSSPISEGPVLNCRGLLG